jgi:hypothetical protein
MAEKQRQGMLDILSDLVFRGFGDHCRSLSWFIMDGAHLTPVRQRIVSVQPLDLRSLKRNDTAPGRSGCHSAILRGVHDTSVLLSCRLLLSGSAWCVTSIMGRCRRQELEVVTMNDGSCGRFQAISLGAIPFVVSSFPPQTLSYTGSLHAHELLRRAEG